MRNRSNYVLIAFAVMLAVALTDRPGRAGRRDRFALAWFPMPERPKSLGSEKTPEGLTWRRRWASRWS